MSNINIKHYHDKPIECAIHLYSMWRENITLKLIENFGHCLGDDSFCCNEI